MQSTPLNIGVAWILYIEIWEVRFYILKFHLVSKTQTFVSDLHIWLLSDKLTCWCVNFFFFFFFGQISSTTPFQRKQNHWQIEMALFFPNSKHRVITLTTCFSTLFQIPKIPKPNLLSHKPNLQLHKWWLQFRSKMAIVRFSSLYLQLVSLFYPTNG